MDTGMGWGIVLSMVAFVIIGILVLVFPKVASVAFFALVIGGLVKAFADGVIAGMK
jgi:hypothetical protein